MALSLIPYPSPRPCLRFTCWPHGIPSMLLHAHTHTQGLNRQRKARARGVCFWKELCTALLYVGTWENA